MLGFARQHPQTLKGIIMASAKPKKKNPRLASGRKRVRQDLVINAANTSLRSKYRTAVKNVEKAAAAGDKTKAAEAFAKAQSVLDTVADKGIFHKNKAARDKSRLAAKVKALALAK
jgi:small subunit ribosomal protein S20